MKTKRISRTDPSLVRLNIYVGYADVGAVLKKKIEEAAAKRKLSVSEMVMTAVKKDLRDMNEPLIP